MDSGMKKTEHNIPIRSYLSLSTSLLPLHSIPPHTILSFPGAKQPLKSSSASFQVGTGINDPATKAILTYLSKLHLLNRVLIIHMNSKKQYKNKINE